ncbi:16S rRNA (cytosine(967)-C(5))-methyltransferase RsmB [Aerococcus sp. 1KP-2016]|uniref:16S rRNA (cytosine(967)-C(5))-methyltransferase RsmB n=1 Tax=Aerococcus sp. 1KP-2016 TaxID=1981982 RepID=UPI000B99C287|nr:16S rRNA (cytosine(967)-C(5))-methyltransferase RsmB [Aerococcus sp. 1KP-2016]OYQ65820.1 16S rRNA (cytosine(967)-C(5))-methyltransferase [Aerococcus sp. 1KP-2016]
MTKQHHNEEEIKPAAGTTAHNTGHNAAFQTPMKMSARFQAMESVTQIIRHNQYINQEVNRVLTEEAVAEADRNLYTNLVYGSVQNYYTLDTFVRDFVDKPNRVKSWLWSLLVISAYQMYYLDNIPSYAVVDEAVRIVRKRGNQTLAKFANGVLRNFDRRYQTMDEFIATKSDPKEILALQASLPMIWVDYFVDRFGFSKAEELAQSLTQTPAITVRANNRFGDVDAEKMTAYADILRAEGHDVAPSPLSPFALRITKGNPAYSSLFMNGDITIQDESALLAVEALNPQAGDTVLDACAAPGGKTVQIAEAVGRTGHVIATDIAKDKLPLIQQNVDRMKVAEHVEILHQDATALTERFGATGEEPTMFDKILVDAPCSGIGLFRRKPDTKYNKSLQDLDALSDIQVTIMNQALPLLKKGGTITYSTCTITKEENEDVVAAILAQHPELTLKSFKGWRENLDQSVQADGTIEILPQTYLSDGFFIASFEKN